MTDEAKAVLKRTNAQLRRLSNRATYHWIQYPNASLELIEAMTEQVEEMRKLGYIHIENGTEKGKWVEISR